MYDQVISQCTQTLKNLDELRGRIRKTACFAYGQDPSDFLVMRAFKAALLAQGRRARKILDMAEDLTKRRIGRFNEAASTAPCVA